MYKNVVYNKHKELPRDYLAINLCAAILKACKYYNKLNSLLAYYAAIILYPRYKSYLNRA
jgi:hypothetical protein